ncbi:hypothetical protein N9948_01515 [bacterium]|nr:hypothetical protein [bacterium]
MTDTVRNLTDKIKMKLAKGDYIKNPQKFKYLSNSEKDMLISLVEDGRSRGKIKDKLMANYWLKLLGSGSAEDTEE